MKLYFMLVFAILLITLIAGCISYDNNTGNNTDNNIIDCSLPCPQYSPPGPDYCPNGLLVTTQNECNCTSPPLCVGRQYAEENYCEKDSDCTLRVNCCNACYRDYVNVYHKQKISAEECNSYCTADCPSPDTFKEPVCIKNQCKPLQILKDEQLCTSAGGHWNGCSSRCAIDNPDATCPTVCEALCECAGIAGFDCPAGYVCKLPALAYMDAMGYCVRE